MDWTILKVFSNLSGSVILYLLWMSWTGLEAEHSVVGRAGRLYAHSTEMMFDFLVQVQMLHEACVYSHPQAGSAELPMNWWCPSSTGSFELLKAASQGFEARSHDPTRTIHFAAACLLQGQALWGQHASCRAPTHCQYTTRLPWYCSS